jgi:hypothetical protein
VWAFAKGTRLTQQLSRQYANKYLLKYLRKEAKAGMKNRIAARWDQKNTIRLGAGISEILEFGYGTASPSVSLCKLATYSPVIRSSSPFVPLA